MKAMKALAFHLFSRYGFKHVFPGKFTSDPIEGRFGWYRQATKRKLLHVNSPVVSGGKKICCLSQLREKALHKLSSLIITQSIISDTCEESPEDHTCLKKWAMQAEINEVSDDDTAVNYYVAGYIVRCISRKRKCDSCISSLIETEHLPCLVDASDVQNALLALADRGGLSASEQYCFAVCALGVQMYSKINGNDSVL